MSDASRNATDGGAENAPRDVARVLAQFGPLVTAESLEDVLAFGAGVAAGLVGARTAALFTMTGAELVAEAWHGTESVSADVRAQLRRLASESAAAGTPCATPFAGDGAELVPHVVMLAHHGRTLGVLGLACDAGGDAVARAATLEPLAPLLACRIAAQQDGVAARATLARYERWFKQLDQHVRVLDRERQKFAAIVNQSDTFVFTADGDGMIRWANRAMASCAPPHHVRGWVGRPAREVWSHFGSADAGRDCPVARALASNQPSHHEYRQADEHAVHNFYVTALPIRSPEGSTLEVLAIVQDLSGLESLRLAEQRLQTVISGLPIVLFALDKDGVTTMSEGRGLKAIGLSPGQVVGESALEMYRDQPAVLGNLRRALAGEEFTAQVEVGGVHFETIYTPLRNDAGEFTGTIGVGTDVTERRRLEDQLRHTHKMEGIGRLAGGVAHDFNNLLSVIMGNTQLMQREIHAGHPLRGCVEELQKAAAQGALLTRQLLSFSRRDQPAPRRLDLNVVVVEMETMLRRLIGDDVEILTQPSADEALVLADRSQLEQVVMNLVVNARDAMPDGGRVTLEVESRNPEAVVLVVTDVGCGMTDDVKRRLFEPFFTTKDRGKGTGLGLALVQGIVQGAGGAIAVDSEPGRGTCVRITLPRVVASPAALERRAA